MRKHKKPSKDLTRSEYGRNDKNVQYGKMEIQKIVEKILAKHGINPSHDFHLMLSNKPYMNLVMERYGSNSTIIVGHYFVQNDDLMSDPILAMEEINGYWSPLRIEQWCGDTICAFDKDGKLTIYPDRMKDFRSFQRMFAYRIKKQGWLKYGVKIGDLTPAAHIWV